MKQTGATALHVACAKGYLRVMSLLIQGGAEVKSQGKKFRVDSINGRGWVVRMK